LILFNRLATLHNLAFYARLMGSLRRDIIAGRTLDPIPLQC